MMLKKEVITNFSVSNRCCLNSKLFHFQLAWQLLPTENLRYHVRYDKYSTEVIFWNSKLRFSTRLQSVRHLSSLEELNNRVLMEMNELALSPLPISEETTRMGLTNYWPWNIFSNLMFFSLLILILAITDICTSATMLSSQRQTLIVGLNPALQRTVSLSTTLQPGSVNRGLSVQVRCRRKRNLSSPVWWLHIMKWDYLHKIMWS